MFSAIFHSVIYQPLFNILILLYNIIPGQDFGIVIIFVTVLVRLILWPLSNKSIKAQKSMQNLQPKIDALKEQYKDNKEKLAQATMELYKTEKINPFASCLPLLIQLPILMGFYWVLSAGLKSQNFEVLYSFVGNPGTIKTIAFGFLDLSRSNIVLAVLAGAAQFWQAKMLPTQKPVVKGAGSKDESMTAMMNKQMMYMMPLMTVFIGATLPAGLTLYWLITTLLTVLQQVIVFKKTNGPAIIKN